MKFRIVIRTRVWQVMRRLVIAAVWIGLGGGLVGAAFLLSFYVAMRVEMSSTQVRVPSLEGLTLEEAGRQVAPMGLVLEIVEQRNDPRVASGCVLEQMPPSGSSVRRGRKLKLILSLGGRVLQVPNLVGHAARAVAIELQQEGFIPGDEARVHSYDMPAGQIIAQVPPSSTNVVPSSRVHRLVSDGPPTPAWVMPDLRGRTREAAERWIRLSGFRRGVVRRVPAPGKMPETVVAQLPLAGYPIRPKDIVELAVAE